MIPAPIFPIDAPNHLLRVVPGLLRGETYREIAEKLGVRESTIACYVNELGNHVPGTLPARMKVTLWAMGYAGAEINRIPWPEGSYQDRLYEPPLTLSKATDGPAFSVRL